MGKKGGKGIRPNFYTSKEIFLHLLKPSAQVIVNIELYQDLTGCFGFRGKVIEDEGNFKMFHICFTQKTKESQN